MLREGIDPAAVEQPSRSGSAATGSTRDPAAGRTTAKSRRSEIELDFVHCSLRTSLKRRSYGTASRPCCAATSDGASYLSSRVPSRRQSALSQSACWPNPGWRASPCGPRRIAITARATHTATTPGRPVKIAAIASSGTEMASCGRPGRRAGSVRLPRSPAGPVRGSSPRKPRRGPCRLPPVSRTRTVWSTWPPGRRPSARLSLRRLEQP